MVAIFFQAPPVCFSPVRFVTYSSSIEPMNSVAAAQDALAQVLAAEVLLINKLVLTASDSAVSVLVTAATQLPASQTPATGCQGPSMCCSGGLRRPAVKDEADVIADISSSAPSLSPTRRARSSCRSSGDPQQQWSAVVGGGVQVRVAQVLRVAGLRGPLKACIVSQSSSSVLDSKYTAKMMTVEKS